MATAREMVLVSPFAGQEERHRCREQTWGRSRGRRGWDGPREELGTYTLPCLKQVANGELLYDAWSSNLVL